MRGSTTPVIAFPVGGVGGPACDVVKGGRCDEVSKEVSVLLLVGEVFGVEENYEDVY